MHLHFRILPALFISAACLGSLQARCQGKWNLLKEKEGIRISTRSSAKSSFKDVLIQVDLPGSADDVVSAVLKVDNYQNWAYATKNSVEVSKLNDSSLIYYSEIVAPWPISNRDLYAAITVHHDNLSKKVSIVCSGVPHFGAVRDHLVRIPYSKGNWLLTDTGPGRVHLDYTVEINPGGNVPAWVLNLFVAKGPYETFSHLRAMLEQSKKTAARS